MKRELTLLCLMVLCAACCSISAADDADSPIPQATMIRAFDAGCSLVIVRVIGTEPRVWDKSDVTLHELLTLCVMQAGDIGPRDLASPVFVMSTASRIVEQGKSYVLFLRKEIPGGFSWAFLDDIVQVNERNQSQVSALAKAAASAYQASSIKAFRERKVDVEPTDLHLTQALRNTLKSFRNKPHGRVAEGKAIWGSGLGSRKDESHPTRSFDVYVPPKYPITRDQALELLGKPTLASGFTYFWYCGPDPQPDFAVHQGPETMDFTDIPHYGVLTVRFDKTGLATYVRYTAFDDEDIRDFHSKWR